MSDPVDVIPSSPYWMKLLEDTSVRDIVQEKNRKMVTANFYEDVSTLLKKMREANVLAVPITDAQKPGVFGFVDVLDIMVHILSVVDSSSSKSLDKETIQNVRWEGKCFSREISGLLVNKSESDPYVTVDIGTSLLDVVIKFAGEVHRLGVTEKGVLVNIISQMDIVKFLCIRGVYIGSKIQRSIVENGLSPLGVASVLDTINVIDAIRYMRDFKCTGVVVVDKNGRMVANFSASDLLGLTDEKFELLTLPVKEFLTRMHGFPKPPVCAKQTSTVEELLLKIHVHNVHRVYIVDDSMHPLGVLTLTDIMQFLLANS